MKQYQRTVEVMCLYDGDEKEILVYPLISNKNKFYDTYHDDIPVGIRSIL